MSEVIIVGAGPTGLLLAGDLAQAGIAVTVLERRAGQSNLTRAFGVHARTLETLDARGLADELVTTGHGYRELRVLGRVSVRPVSAADPVPVRAGHTAVRDRAGAPGACGVARRPDRRRAPRCSPLRQDADGVDVDVRSDGDGVHARATFLVGTDGVRSTVRTQLGLPFPGRSAIRSVMLADVRLADAPADVLTVNAIGDAFGFVAPFGDGWYRVIAWNRHDQLPDDAPVDLDEIRSVVRQALGTDYGMHDARWLSRFHSDERQVPTYRVGRVFLAGDAAHVHSPGRRAGHEHRAAGRGEPRAGSSPPPCAARRSPACSTPTRTSGTRSAGWCCGSAAACCAWASRAAGNCRRCGWWPARCRSWGRPGGARPGWCPAFPSGTGGRPARTRGPVAEPRTYRWRTAPGSTRRYGTAGSYSSVT